MNFTFDFGENLPPETQAKIHDGMAQADANADVKWRHLIDHCVVSAARKKAEISIDDVLDEFDALPQDVRPTTHNWSALGTGNVPRAEDGRSKAYGSGDSFAARCEAWEQT
jgi:hypothetical protein